MFESSGIIMGMVSGYVRTYLYVISLASNSYTLADVHNEITSFFVSCALCHSMQAPPSRPKVPVSSETDTTAVHEVGAPHNIK